jgi:predicted NUDIX family phosphoesterase
MRVDPQEAIAREHKARISNVRGSIMNEQSLASVNRALSDAVDSYGSAFKNILIYDTTGERPRKTNITIANDLLGHLERFLDPQILVIDIEALQSIVNESDSCFSFKNSDAVLSHLKKHCSFMKRSEAEVSENVVQIIPCAMLMHSDRILLFERTEKDPKVELHGRSTIWQGAHVANTETSLDAIIENALFSKLRDKLFINRRFPVTLLGYAWDHSTPEKRKHMGLFYKLAIDSEGVAADFGKRRSGAVVGIG